jgi:hypothetical protein
MNNDKFLDGVISSEGVCGFLECWVGKCKKINCEKHKNLKCRCGTKATFNCGETHGPSTYGDF